jgi:amidase
LAQDLLFRPASELATLVHTGQVSSTELVTAALERIEQLQPTINAFVHVDPDGALQTAAEIDRDDPRPFAGVPIAMKDTTAVQGMPYTMGSDLFGDFVPGHDSHVTRRVRDAGFVIVGKTNMPEFGILPVSEPRRYGPARNPWDTDRTPGGSSGGAAAAVAGGMVPLAHGSDGGGSIRIPAACTGLVGLKPTRGRISRGPDLGDDFLVVDGSLTRTVAETAQMLDVLSGYEIGDASWAPPPSELFSEATKRDPGRLKIGYTLCERATLEAAQLLTELGHDVEEVEAPWGGQELFEAFLMAFGTPISMGMYFGGMVTGREPTEELVEPLSWAMWNAVRERSALDYLLARTQLSAVSRGIIALWETYDAILSPTLAARPVRIGELDGCSDDPWDDFKRSSEFTPYAAIYNVTGQPAITLPLFHGDDGLPTAIQLGGRPAGEAELLSLAAQVEAARPWADRRPEPAAAERPAA